MKRIIFVGALLLCLPVVGVAYFSRWYDVRSGWPLRLDPATHDFGKVKWSDTPKYTLHFVNTSRQDVVIWRVGASCGCLVARLSSRRLRPGEGGSLSVRLDPTGFAGEMSDTIQLYLHGFPQPVTFHVRANVVPPLIPSPTVVNFGQVKPRKQASAKVVLKNTSDQPVRITRVSSSADYIHAHLLAASSADNRHPVVVISLVNPPVGKLYEHLSVQTSLKRQSQIDIPIQAEVSCKWALSAPELFFGFVNLGQRLSRKTVVSGLRPAEVIRTWIDMSGASVRTAPHTSPPGIEVIAELDLTKVQEGPLKGSVFIETNDKEQPLLRIPVVGSVQDPSRSGCCSRE